MTPVLLAVALRAVVVVDRVEGDVAVVEAADGALFDWPVAALPPGAREGDRLVVRVRRGPRTPDSPVRRTNRQRSTR